MEAHALSDTRVELGGVVLGGQYEDEQGRPFVVIADTLRAQHYESTPGSFKFTHETWADFTRQRADLPGRPANRRLVPYASELGRVPVRDGSLHLRALLRSAGGCGPGHRSVPRPARVLSMDGACSGPNQAYRRVLPLRLPASRTGIDLFRCLLGGQNHGPQRSPSGSLSFSRNAVSGLDGAVHRSAQLLARPRGLGDSARAIPAAGPAGVEDACAGVERAGRCSASAGPHGRCCRRLGRVRRSRPRVAGRRDPTAAPGSNRGSAGPGDWPGPRAVVGATAARERSHESRRPRVSDVGGEGEGRE